MPRNPCPLPRADGPPPGAAVCLDGDVVGVVCGVGDPVQPWPKAMQVAMDPKDVRRGISEAAALSAQGRFEDAVRGGVGTRLAVEVGAVFGIEKAPKWTSLFGAALEATGDIRWKASRALQQGFLMSQDEIETFLEVTYTSALEAGVNDQDLAAYVARAISIPPCDLDRIESVQAWGRLAGGIHADHILCAVHRQAQEGNLPAGVGNVAMAAASLLAAWAIPGGQDPTPEDIRRVRATLDACGVHPVSAILRLVPMVNQAPRDVKEAFSSLFVGMGVPTVILEAIRVAPGGDPYVDLGRIFAADLPCLEGLTADYRLSGQVMPHSNMDPASVAALTPILRKARPHTVDMGPTAAAEWLSRHLAECPVGLQGHRFVDVHGHRSWTVGLQPVGVGDIRGGTYAAFESPCLDTGTERVRVEVRYAGDAGRTVAAVVGLLVDGVPVSERSVMIGGRFAAAVSEAMGPRVALDPPDGVTQPFDPRDLVSAITDALESGWSAGDGGFIHVRARKFDANLSITTPQGNVSCHREMFGFRSDSQDPPDGMRSLPYLPDTWVTVPVTEGDSLRNLATRIVKSYILTMTDRMAVGGVQ